MYFSVCYAFHVVKRSRQRPAFRDRSSMDKRFILQAVLFVLLTASSEAIFLDSPRKALVDFLLSFKEKKEPKKAERSNVHHYHLHYFPSPISLIGGKPVKAPDDHELDYLHKKKLRSFGWTDHEYKYVPESGIVYPVLEYEHVPKHDLIYPLHELKTLPEPEVAFPVHEKDSWSSQYHEIPGQPWEDDLDLSGINHEVNHNHEALEHHEHHPPHVLLHLPLHQEIIVQQPPHKEEKKPHPFFSFFQNLQHIKNSLFNHSEKHEEHCEDKAHKSVISSKLEGSKAYAVYFHPKNLHKLIT